MDISLRALLLGTDQPEHDRTVVLALAVAGFVVTFAGYASGVFSTSGGVLLIPFYAAVIGMIAGGWIGYSKNGLLFACISAYASMLGYHAEDALLGSRSQSLGERVGYLVRPDVHAALGVEAIVFGAVAFVFGLLVRVGFDLFRGRSASTPAGKSN